MASSYSQAILAQGSSNDPENSEMQSFTLEFNSVSGPAISRTLDLSFSELTSEAFDEGFDTKNLNFLADDLNLLLDGEYYTTQAYSPLNEEKIVDLAFQASGSYNYSIQVTNMDNMGYQGVEIRDNLYGITFDLSYGDIFEFSSESGYFPNRFDITFKVTTTLSQNNFDLENLDVRYVNGTRTIAVSNPNNIDLKSIEAYNITGQKVYNNNASVNDSTINYQVGNLTAGVYVIRLTTVSDASLTKKVFIR